MGNCWGSSPVDISHPPIHPLTNQLKTDGIYNRERGDREKIEESLPDGSQTWVTGESSYSVGKIVTLDLKVFTLAELKSTTKNFKPVTMWGEGGFGRVFKGWIDKTTLAPSKFGVGMAVAVKKCSPDSTQGIKEWKDSSILYMGNCLKDSVFVYILL